LFYFNDSLYGLIACLWVFFCGFNLLEATLPSLISKTAPGNLKGTAMGAYSSSQFFGAFLGGTTGGWIYGEYGASYVFLFCAVAASTWLLVALFMNPPKYLANLLVSTEAIAADKLDDFLADVLAVVGVASADLQASENVVYLKVDNSQLDKDKLQYLLTQWSGSV